MNKTFDFLNDKALAVFDDRLPVVVKYNGNTLHKLSALTKTIDNSKTNINEISYTSEYNKSLRNLSIDGNTTQKTYSGTNLFNQQLLLDSGFFIKEIYNGVECIRAVGYVNIPFEAPVGTYTFSFDWAQPNGVDMYAYIVLEDGTKIAIIATTNGDKLPELKRYNRTVNATSKIVSFNFGAWNYNTKPMYFKDMMLNTGGVKTYEPYVGEKYSPSLDYPQPIENVNITSLPSEYREVEYIESTGTQIIDTGFNPTNNTRVLLDMKLTNLISDGTGIGNAICGCYDETNVFSINFGADVAQATKLFCWVNARQSYGGTHIILNVDTAVNSRSTLSLTNTSVRYGIYNATLTEGSWTTMLTSLRMFGYLNGSGVEMPLERYHMVLYGAKIYNNDTLVRNFVPCYRKSDDVVGLYDLVNNKFYTNNGTGEFLKGADVSNEASVVVHGNNLFDLDELLKLSNFTMATYDGQECIKVANNGTFNIPFEIPANTKFSFSYERAFPKADYYWFFKFDDGTYTSSGFTSGYYPNTAREQFEKVTKPNLSYTKNIVAIQMRMYGSANSGYYPMYFRNIMANLGTTALPYEPYFREEIAIPESVEVDGSTVPLLFSKWDKLTVDKVANKVTYTEGSWQKTFNGNERWYKSTWAQNNGYGNLYCLATGRDYGVTPVTQTGYSNCFVRARFINEAPNNSFIVSDEITSTDAQTGLGHYGIIQFYTDKTSPVADFKSLLQQKHADGNPVNILVKRKNSITHDITNTDLGKSILDLTNQIPYGTIYLEVNSEQIVPIEVGYAKWGGNDE